MLETSVPGSKPFIEAHLAFDVQEHRATGRFLSRQSRFFTAQSLQKNEYQEKQYRCHQQHYPKERLAHAACNYCYAIGVTIARENACE
jgi:hypothetical protein